MVKLGMQMKVLTAESGNVFQKILSLHYLILNHFTIGMKASVLIYEKLNFVPGVYIC